MFRFFAELLAQKRKIGMTTITNVKCPNCGQSTAIIILNPYSKRAISVDNYGYAWLNYEIICNSCGYHGQFGVKLNPTKDELHKPYYDVVKYTYLDHRFGGE